MLLKRTFHHFIENLHSRNQVGLLPKKKSGLMGISEYFGILEMISEYFLMVVVLIIVFAQDFEMDLPLGFSKVKLLWQAFCGPEILMRIKLEIMLLKRP